MKVQYVLMLLLFATAFAEEVPTSGVKSYEGDKVFQLTPYTTEQLSWLQGLSDNSESYDFWTRPRFLNASVEVHVNKNSVTEFEMELEQRGLNATINVGDLQQLIDDVEGGEDGESHNFWKAAKTTTAKAAKPKSILRRFPRYNEIVAWYSSLCNNYSSLATCGTIGKSFENRDIPYIKLSITGSSPSGKQIICVDAGTHAREWLGIATSIHMLNRLLTTYNTDSVAKAMLDTYDWIFVPVLNPDGYEYSRTERMWRKTRSRRSGVSCVGVDPNRNFDAFWGTTGTSNNSCSEVYHGPFPFSEPETKALSSFLVERKSQILAYFSFHTFSQKWLIPFTDKADHYPTDFAELLRVAQIGSKALMAVNKTKWTIESGGGCSGVSIDYAKLIGIKYAYFLELRPTSGNGFIVSEKQIDPSGREVWAGITAAVAEMKP